MSTVPNSTDWPLAVRALFWEYDTDALDGDADRDLIVRRVLCEGDWAAITWLREHLDDAALRAWLMKKRGSDLSPRQLRFWELVLDLPHDQVDAWIEAQRSTTWTDRAVS